VAWSAVSLEDIEYIARSLVDAGAKLQEVAKQMRREDHKSMYLQITSARAYADACRKLANDAELHFHNQLHCAKHGGTPIWMERQQKSAYNRALKEAKQSRAEQGIEPPKKPQRKPKDS